MSDDNITAKELILAVLDESGVLEQDTLDAKTLMLKALDDAGIFAQDEWSEENLSEADKASLEKHDKARHKGHFDPETMTCKFREQLKQGAKMEDLKDEVDDPDITENPDVKGYEQKVAEKEEKDRKDSEIEDIKINEAGSGQEVRNKITPEMDKAYMEAVNRKDWNTAEKLIKEAAAIAMPNTKFHGEYTHSTNAEFTKFDRSVSHGVYGDGFYFYKKGVGEKEYGQRVIYAFLNAENPFRFYKQGHYDAETKVDAVCDAVEKARLNINRNEMHDLYDDEGENLEEAELVSYVKEATGIEFSEILEKAGYDALEANSGIEFIVFNPNQIKSSALIERDDKGNIIPLSKRFNMFSTDIRGTESTQEVSKEEELPDNGNKSKAEEKHDANTQKALNKRAQEEYEEVVKRFKGTPLWMKAPNGNDTNLTERQWVQVRTPSFKAWFGDWENDPSNASKAVDTNGEPKVVYRRDNEPFTIFDFDKTQQNDAGWLGKGFYFYGDKGEAERAVGYGENLRAFHLKSENPYFITAEEYNRLVEADDPKVSAEFTQWLKDEGYDSVYWNGDVREEWMVVDPTQIKSATDNSGTFNSTSAIVNDEKALDMETDINISEVTPNPDIDRIPDPFEAPIKGFVFTRSQIEDYIRKHIEESMKEMGLTMRDMAVRGGTNGNGVGFNSNGKFLETVFEYDDLGRGIYEDEVLKYLDKYHPMALEGVRVKFRPINDKQTGSLDDYWKTFNDRMESEDKARKEEDARKSQYLSLHNADVPEPPPPRVENPNDTHNLDYQSKIDVDIYQDNADPGAAAKKTDKFGLSNGVPFSRDEISQIAAALGTTTDYRQGGWILPDGRLLRFITDGIRRKEQDIGIGFTEERKRRISNEIKKIRENKNPSEHKESTKGPYDINGYAQSQPVDPYGSLAEPSFPEAFPLEAIRGGLIRYAISPDGDGVEIDVYQIPTEGQVDALEDIHEWIKFVNDGGYDRDNKPNPQVQSNAELTYTQPQQIQNAAQYRMVDEDNYEKTRRERQENADAKIDSSNNRFNSPIPNPSKEDIPSSRLIVVYVGSGPDDWWDYDNVEDVKRNLVKDLRTYFRDGKMPNEDFNIPEDYEDDGLDDHGENAVATDESVGWLKGRNADIFPKRIYRPRSTLLKQVDYDTARRIVREGVSLIKTIPMLDILKAEQKVLAYFRLKITRDQLARYFYRIADGAITRAWSEVIADDQINKASERLRVAKWRKNGVRMVRWVHCHMDEPRPYHKERWNGASGIFDGRPNGLNGYVFPIDHPPVIDLRTGERGYPGHLINCKCHLEPVS